MPQKQEIPNDIKKIVSHIDAKIEMYKNSIAWLETTKKMWLETSKKVNQPLEINAPLTRDLIRRFMGTWGKPLRTVEAIDALYSGISEKERKRLIRMLSVMFNQMEKEGEMEIIKEEGVKGNYYKLKNKKAPKF